MEDWRERHFLNVSTKFEGISKACVEAREHWRCGWVKMLLLSVYTEILAAALG